MFTKFQNYMYKILKQNKRDNYNVLNIKGVLERQIYKNNECIFSATKNNTIVNDSNWIMPRVLGNIGQYNAIMEFHLGGKTIGQTEQENPRNPEVSDTNLYYNEWVYRVNRLYSWSDNDWEANQPYPNVEKTTIVNDDTQLEETFYNFKQPSEWQKGVPMFTVTYPQDNQMRVYISIPEKKGNISGGVFTYYSNAGLACPVYKDEDLIDDRNIMGGDLYTENDVAGVNGKKFKYFSMQSFPVMPKTKSLNFVFIWNIYFGN